MTSSSVGLKKSDLLQKFIIRRPHSRSLYQCQDISLDFLQPVARFSRQHWGFGIKSGANSYLGLYLYVSGMIFNN